MFQLNNIYYQIIYVLPAVIVALCVHEFAHAFVSYKFGDLSQRQSKRMSLNPLRHLDPIGTLCLFTSGFGWAKPVMVDPRYYRNKKEGMMWTALAGPLINLIVAFLATLLFYLFTKFAIQTNNSIIEYLKTFCVISAQLNIGLAIFNLIPIPPLDGSKILLGILPEETYFKIMRYENYCMIILFLILISGIFDTTLFQARNVILELFSNIATFLLNI